MRLERLIILGIVSTWGCSTSHSPEVPNFNREKIKEPESRPPTPAQPAPQPTLVPMPVPLPSPVGGSDNTNNNTHSNSTTMDAQPEKTSPIPTTSTMPKSSEIPASDPKPLPQTKRYSLFYSSETSSKNDCLIANAPYSVSPISVSPCTSNIAMAFDLKPIGGSNYQIVSALTGKCLGISPDANNQDPNGQALIQFECPTTQGPSSTFFLDATQSLTKVSIGGLCVKLGLRANAYLATCDVAWTWFSKFPM